MSRNCRKLQTVPGMLQYTTHEGFAGVFKTAVGERLLFRPDRGSGGWVPYETEDQCRRFTGCEQVRRVKVTVEVL